MSSVHQPPKITLLKLPSYSYPASLEALLCVGLSQEELGLCQIHTPAPAIVLGAGSCSCFNCCCSVCMSLLRLLLFMLQCFPGLEGSH